MNTPNTWDLIDTKLLAAANKPSTLNELIGTTGFTGDVVKNLVEGYHSAELVTRTVDVGVRYQLTVAGRRRLDELKSATTRRSSHAHRAAA